MSLKRILVPVDFAAASRAALNLAIGLAENWHAEVDVLHVVEVPAYELRVSKVAAGESPTQSFAAYAQHRAFDEMKTFLAPDRENTEVKIIESIVTGEATNTILNEAKDRGYELIVMGTHGRSGLKHVLLGSVAETVVRNAPCPVLTTRDPRE